MSERLIAEEMFVCDIARKITWHYWNSFVSGLKLFVDVWEGGYMRKKLLYELSGRKKK